MKLGAFMMPSHPPERAIGAGIDSDLAQLRLLDELGFREAWIGEHFTAPWEPCPAPDLLIAQALRDALVAANHLAPLAARPADPGELLSACQRINRERLPEVKVIQRLQSVPPRFMFQRTVATRFAVRRLLPALARSGVLPLVIGIAARRFLFGTTEVRLHTRSTT